VIKLKARRAQRVGMVMLGLVLAEVLFSALCSAQVSGNTDPSVFLSRNENDPPTFRLTIEKTSASTKYDIYRSFDLTSNNWDLIGNVLGDGGTVIFDDDTIG